MGRTYKYDNCIIKEYIFLNNVNYKYNYDLNFLFKNEINSVKKLAEIKNNFIQTPVILSINHKKMFWKQKFFKGHSFYKYLIINCNIFYFNKNLGRLFLEFGNYLGKLHDENFKHYNYRNPISFTHGDLASHNVMFLSSKKMFIYDPGLPNQSVYVDLAKFILNLRFYNFFYKLLLSQKKLYYLENQFKEGYKNSILKFNFDEKQLKKTMLELLKEDRQHISNKLTYKLKKYIMNLENQKLYKQIKKELSNGKI